MENESKSRIKIYARIMKGEEISLGPGKADLLDAIIAHGSISAASRAMNISYRRVCNMVEAMNNGFKEPLVKTSTGGTKGGGAFVTDLGKIVLQKYRKMQAELEEVANRHFKSICEDID